MICHYFEKNMTMAFSNLSFCEHYRSNAIKYQLQNCIYRKKRHLQSYPLVISLQDKSWHLFSSVLRGKKPLHPLKDSQPASQSDKAAASRLLLPSLSCPAPGKHREPKRGGGEHSAHSVPERRIHMSTARPAAYFHHIGLCTAARAWRREMQNGAFVMQHYVESYTLGPAHPCLARRREE